MQLSTTPDAEKILKSFGEVAVLPQVVFKISELTTSDTSTAGELEKVIMVDPGFSTKILAQVNSAKYALPKKITSIKDAIMFLGLQDIRQLAMTLGVFDMFFGKTDKDSLIKRGWWKQSVDTANAAKSITNDLKLQQSEIAYSCGLLHYLGRTILNNADPELYAKVLILESKNVPLWQAEEHLFKCNHVQLGMMAAENWGFPEVLTQGLNYVSKVNDLDPYAKLKATINVANQCATLNTLSLTPDQINPSMFNSWALQTLDSCADNLQSLYQNVQSSIQNAKSAGF